MKLGAGEGKISIQDVDEPHIKQDDEVKIRVKAAGVCGSDIEILHGKHFLCHPPVIMGHEFTGEVVEIGKKAKKFKIGDKVVFEPTAGTCGECRYCQDGQYNLCSNRLIAGLNYPGGFAEFAVRKQRYVHKLPNSVDYVAGALCEPLAVCCHAILELTPLRVGDIVAIIGPGTIGLLSLQLVKISGGYPIVIGTGKDTPRLNLAKNLGANYAIDIEREGKSFLQLIKQITKGYGVDVVIGCCGSPAAFSLGIELLRKGGHYTQVGLFGKDILFPADMMTYRELTIQGSMAQKPSAWRKAIALLGKGLVDTLSLTTCLPMSRWEEGFEMAENKEAIKVIFDPGK